MQGDSSRSSARMGTKACQISQSKLKLLLLNRMGLNYWFRTRIFLNSEQHGNLQDPAIWHKWFKYDFLGRRYRPLAR